MFNVKARVRAYVKSAAKDFLTGLVEGYVKGLMVSDPVLASKLDSKWRTGVTIQFTGKGANVVPPVGLQ